MALKLAQMFGKHSEEYSNLSNLVAELRAEMSVDFTTAQTNENESLDNAEKQRAENINFSHELKFEEDPKQFVLDSKKAFKLFISGLNDDMRYDQLMELAPHNPNSFPYQMGEGKLDVGPLQKAAGVMAASN